MSGSSWPTRNPRWIGSKQFRLLPMAHRRQLAAWVVENEPMGPLDVDSLLEQPGLMCLGIHELAAWLRSRGVVYLMVDKDGLRYVFAHRPKPYREVGPRTLLSLLWAAVMTTLKLDDQDRAHGAQYMEERSAP